MSFWCRIGLHARRAKSAIVAGSFGPQYVTWNRCNRAGCKYEEWRLLEDEPVHPEVMIPAQPVFGGFHPVEFRVPKDGDLYYVDRARDRIKPDGRLVRGYGPRWIMERDEA